MIPQRIRIKGGGWPLTQKGRPGWILCILQFSLQRQPNPTLRSLATDKFRGLFEPHFQEQVGWENWLTTAMEGRPSATQQWSEMFCKGRVGWEEPDWSEIRIDLEKKYNFAKYIVRSPSFIRESACNCFAYDKVSTDTASSVSKTSKFRSGHRVVKMVLNT